MSILSIVGHGDSLTAQVFESTHEAWKAHVDDAILELAVAGKPFSVDDVRALVTGWSPDHPNAWGARFLSAQKEGIIRVAGFEPSPRRSRHASIRRVWEGC